MSRALVTIYNQGGLLIEEEVDDLKADLIAADSGALVYRNQEKGITCTWAPGSWTSAKYAIIEES